MVEEIKKKVCALMGCELSPDDVTLENIIHNYPTCSVGRKQALKLIYIHGFKENDILCPDCFWK